MNQREFEEFLDNGAKSDEQIAVDQYAAGHFPEILKLVPTGDGEFIVVKSKITDSAIGWD